MSLLRLKHPARLIILGEGLKRRDTDRVRSTIGLDEAVDLPGRVDNPFAYPARASLCVLSSTYEGMPSALIEALACGCPAVSTDCPAEPPEILDGGRFGRLVPVGDADAMARVIETTFDDPLSHDRLRARAADFFMDRTVERYLACLRPYRFLQPAAA